MEVHDSGTRRLEVSNIGVKKNPPPFTPINSESKFALQICTFCCLAGFVSTLRAEEGQGWSACSGGRCQLPGS